MMQTGYIHRIFSLSVLLAVAILVSVALPAYAQEVADTEAADAVVAEAVADTLVEASTEAADQAPEWYVAPVIAEKHRAPRRAKLAAKCLTDSVVTYDINENVTYVAAYDYDDAEHCIRTVKWACNTDGTRIGEEKKEYGFDASGTQVMSAVYEWSASANNWLGTEKIEYVYDDEKRMTSKTEYAWADADWVKDTRYEYIYDAEGREKEFATFKRDITTNQLVYSNRRIREWNADGQLTLDVQYSAYSAGNPSAGTQEKWEFNGSSKQLTLHEKYTWATSDWSITLQEKTGYDNAGNNTLIENYTFANGVKTGTKKVENAFNSSKKKTSAITYKWSNGDWIGSVKEIWEFNGPSGKQTLHEKYTWATADWSMSLQENTGYDAAGNTTLIENYSFANGVKTGTKKEECTFNASKKKTSAITYTWSNNTWVDLEKEIWEFNGPSSKQTLHEKYSYSSDWDITLQEKLGYDAAGNNTLIENYTFAGGVKTGTKKEEYTYSSKTKTSSIISAWTNGAWVYTDKEVWGYTSGKQTLHEQYVWGATDWTITLQEKSGYDAAGNTNLVEVCKLIDGVWTGEKKEEYTFNAAKQKTEIIISAWVDGKWEYSTKAEADYLGDIKTMEANYKWQNGAWVGDGYRTEDVYDDGKLSLAMAYTWDATGKTWVYASRRAYVYDDKERLIGDTTQVYVNSAWVNYALQTHGYNSKGDDTLAVTATWNETKWDTTYLHKKINEYNAAGKPLLVEEYEGAPGALAGKTKIEYTYDDYGHQIKYMQYEWKANKTWGNKTRSEQTYDAEGKNVILSESYTWGQNKKKTKYIWLGTNKYEWEYDYSLNPKGLEVMQSRYNWDKNNDKWTGASRTTKTYDDNGEIAESISYSWRSTGWMESTREKFVRDNRGNVTEYVMSSWGGDLGWMDSEKNEFKYDSKGQTISTHKYLPINNSWSLYYIDDQEYDLLDNKLRRETKGSWSEGVLESYYDKRYFYSCDTHNYTICFANEDGSLLKAYTLQQGEMPVYDGVEPTKPENAQYSYTFAGWDNEIVPATRNATYRATYTGTKKSYKITWLNEDGTQIDQTVVEYGVVPTHANATKPNTAEWTYKFAGWDNEPVAVTGDATYKATFAAAKTKYTITWLNDDDSQIDQTVVEYGVVPTHTNATKANTAEFTYTFAGWNVTPVAVTGEATYKATFTSTTNEYAITFKNGDVELQSSKVAYGEMPTYNGATPEKAADVQYTYAFKGWDAVIVAVTGDATYNAEFSSVKNKYIITWLNDDDTQIDQTEVEYGVVPTHTDAIKANTAEWTYTFAGWDATPVAVTGDATYKATFSSVKNKYTITWLNDDDSQIDQTEVEYGVVPTHADAAKTKTAEWTYTFAGWDATPVAVTGEATYKATFSSVKNKYTITWLNDDDSQIDQTEVEYGVVPTHADAAKVNTAEWTYTFTGWDNDPVAVTSNATYKATFSSVKNKYTITWLNDDDSQIDQTEVEYGVVPTHADATKSNTAEWTYTFSGWDNEPVAVTGNATYKATFSSVKNKYTITWLNDDNTQIDLTEVEYGVVPTHADAAKVNTAEWTYTFTGWDNEPVAVTGNATYKATFSSVKNKYMITFMNGEEELQSTEVEYGLVPDYVGETPTQPEDEQFTYQFAGWDKEIAEVTEDATYYAIFNKDEKLPTAITNTQAGANVQKIIRDNQVLIIRDGKTYTTYGIELR